MGCLKNVTRAIFLTVVVVGFMAFGGQDYLKRVIKDYNEDFDNWKEIFTRFVDPKSKKQIIDKDIMADTIKNMGFKVNDEDIQELINKMDGDLDENKFCDIMKYVETRFQRMQRRK